MAIRTLLIANRGEIACRIARTARAMGIRSVAVYSDADADAPHVAAADLSVRIGPAPVAESYLSAEAILGAAQGSGADAVHPGYGFLSENAEFARAVIAAGLVWVGPPPDAIALMGDKAAAKRAMIAAGVLCVAGYEDEDQEAAPFIAAAERIGFPVMVKATAGGGGRGMRLVQRPEDLPEALDLARSEAESAFGSGHLILEKAVQRPRHVEIQVFADRHGTVLHLGERDCSVQRRHQKVLEEAPSPAMTPALRAEMGAAAVAAARAVNYCGAGTVEFLLDGDGRFYFLEMNTRLQVEHPVTELVTGLDLVALQLKVADGAPLGLSQDDVMLNGHAIEARLYAEDPAAGFLPATGPIALWSPPDGIRTDAGIRTGGDVSPHYDPMLAKLIAWGETRSDALRRLGAALDETVLFGPRTNLAFLADAVAQPVFADGQATTAFVEEVYGAAGMAPPDVTERDLIAAAMACHISARAAARSAAPDVPEELLEWSSSAPRGSVSIWEREGRTVKIRVEYRRGDYSVSLDGEHHAVRIHRCHGDELALTIDDVPDTYRFLAEPDGGLFLALGATTHHLVNLAARPARAEEVAGTGAVTAPMHGHLLAVQVPVGRRVARGDSLAVLEAMKMQHQILAEVDGIVETIAVEPGAQIAAGALILRIAPDAPAT